MDAGEAALVPGFASTAHQLGQVDALLTSEKYIEVGLGDLGHDSGLLTYVPRTDFCPAPFRVRSLLHHGTGLGLLWTVCVAARFGHGHTARGDVGLSLVVNVTGLGLDLKKCLIVRF